MSQSCFGSGAFLHWGPRVKIINHSTWFPRSARYRVLDSKEIRDGSRNPRCDIWSFWGWKLHLSLQNRAEKSCKIWCADMGVKGPTSRIWPWLNCDVTSCWDARNPTLHSADMFHHHRFQRSKEVFVYIWVCLKIGHIPNYKTNWKG